MIGVLYDICDEGHCTLVVRYLIIICQTDRLESTWSWPFNVRLSRCGRDILRIEDIEDVVISLAGWEIVIIVVDIVATICLFK